MKVSEVITKDLTFDGIKSVGLDIGSRTAKGSVTRCEMKYILLLRQPVSTCRK